MLLPSNQLGSRLERRSARVLSFAHVRKILERGRKGPARFLKGPRTKLLIGKGPLPYSRVLAEIGHARA